MATPTNRTPIKLARGSYSNLNSSLDDIQEGEIIYAEDQNKLYVKEGTSLIDVTGSGGGGGTPEGTSILSTGETGTTKFLRVDGDGSCSWQVPPDTNTQVSIDDTPVNGVTNEAISSNWAFDHNAATGNSAHVPAAGSAGQFLKHDGTWDTPPDTNTTYSVGDGGLTTKDFTTTLKTKLDGIATGAEVNVQSDWNSSSGDSQILNKPTVPSSLSDLSDVHNATPSDGQVLKWVNAQSRWEPGADSTGGGGGGATNLSNTADGTKLTIESSSGTNTDLPAVTTSAWGVMTDEQLTALNANTAKVTNATHTGDVTGSGALTIADEAVTYAKMQHVSATNRVLGRDTAGAGDVEEISPASLRTMLNVADGATANTGTVTSVTGTSPIASSGGTTPAISISAATTSAAGSMSSADKTKLDGIATSANNYTHPAVNHIPAGGSSGQVLKYSSDGTAAWGTDNDTTYSAVSTSAAGLAPALPSSHGGKFLKADGTWVVPPDTNTQINIDDTPVNGVTNEAISSNWAYDHNAATGNSAHVPAVGSSGQFLKHDGTWGIPPDTNTQLTEEQVEDFVGGMVTGNTETGITVTYQDADGTLDFAVAAQTPEGTAILSTGETGGTKFLREDGDGTCSWQTVSAGGSGDVTAVTAGTGLTGGGTSGDLTINADVGIGDDKLVQMDDADAADDDYAKFTANGLEGRSATEVKTDLSLNNVENTAISSWAGSSNVTTLGTVTTLTSSTTTGDGGGSARKIFYADTGPDSDDGAVGDIWLEY
tara:strand:- start:6307 stop:8607 length:2301 start_codon:yes stop_codon:yes gene_type:complete